MTATETKQPETKKEPAKKEAKPEYKMPPAYIGMEAVWFLPSDGKRCAATVVGVGGRTVTLMVFTNIHDPFRRTKDAVRHCSDKEANEYDKTTAGFWDYTEEAKQIEARLSLLEEMLNAK